jgi:hypothetical protein
MGDKKLYQCVVKVVYYAYTENEDEAEMLCEEALGDLVSPWNDTYAHEVKTRHHTIASEWDRNCLVYTEDDREIKLGTVLDRLPGEH